MKVFWSWQSDTPGKIGRHFVRAALEAAVEALKQPNDIEEPTTAEAREALHLDHDRKGVSGSPDLAPTIFRKIDASAVFVADVTLVGVAVPHGQTVNDNAKRLINSNVAIEYGYALRSLTDAAVLAVQNVHFGDREHLPFDLKHKAGPIQFSLAPDATKVEIAAEAKKLRASLIEALKLYVERPARQVVSVPAFNETPTTINRAAFWTPGEIVATLRRGGGFRPEHEDVYSYSIDASQLFYARIIPGRTLDAPLSVRDVTALAEKRPAVLTRTINGGMPSGNRFGAMSYESHGTSTNLVAFTQFFRNGEIWLVSRELVVQFDNKAVIAMANVENIFSRVLISLIDFARTEMGLPEPYAIEIGAVGLEGMCVSLPQGRGWHNQVSQPIYEASLHIRRVLHDLRPATLQSLVSELIVELYDLAAIDPNG
jgi:hypothetical protein